MFNVAFYDKFTDRYVEVEDSFEFQRNITRFFIDHAGDYVSLAEYGKQIGLELPNGLGEEIGWEIPEFEALDIHFDYDVMDCSESGGTIVMFLEVGTVQRPIELSIV